MADILISKFRTTIPRVGATPATPGFAESEGQDPVNPSGSPIQYGIGAGLSLDSLNQIQLGNDGAGVVDISDRDIFEEGFVIKDNGVNSGNRFSLLENELNLELYEVDPIGGDSELFLDWGASIFRAKVTYFPVEGGKKIQTISIGSNGKGGGIRNPFLMIITDEINSKGFEYTADYSANWTDHSLVTKSWVLDQVSGSAHNPVTIGSPANGLSIDGSQVLTIGLASTSANGALSSTDWNTFNNKLNLTSPITGYTVGANTALADTDTILQAFGKVQGQINARISGTIASGQVAFGTGVNTVGGDAGITWDNTTKILTLDNTTGGIIYLRDTDAVASFNTTYIQEVNNNFQIGTRTSTGTFVDTFYQVGQNASGANLHQFFTQGVERIRIISTGLVGIGNITPTNTLDVNGTARIRTISNLGTAATSVLVPSATGVVSLRTATEFLADAGGISGSGISTRIAYWNATGSITSDSDLVWLDSVNDLRITGSSSTTGLLSLYNSTNLRGQLGSGAGEFFISASGGFTPIIFRTSGTVNRWSILSNGVFQAEGSQSITTTSNGNLSLTPNGTGLVMIGSGTPTNLLDVNGTARIRTISNLGSAATSVLVPSATGVLSLRTLAEFASDAGLTPLSGLTTNRIIKATSASTVGNTGITEESSISYLFGNRTLATTATPLKVSFGADIGNNTVGSSGNLKWLLFDNGTASDQYGIGISSALMEFRAGNTGAMAFFTNNGVEAMRILNNQQVRIGTAFSPSTAFQLNVFNNTLFGTDTITSTTNPLLVSLGGTVGSNAVGSNGNVKLAIFRSGAAANTYGIGISSSLMEIRAGSTGAIGFFVNDAQESFRILSTKNIQLADAVNFIFNTTTGTRIGTATNQRLAFWNKTPIVQPTNAIGAGAFVANTSGIVNDTATYGGYTMGQIAQALINVGILA